MKKHRFIKYALICLITLLLAGAASKTTKAQTAAPLTVAPARQVIKIDPGKISSFSVRFFNAGDIALTGFVKVADFIVLDKSGVPQLIEDTSKISSRFSAANWITLSSEKLNIAASDKASILGSINIPVDAHPGGRYVAIYFEPDNPIPQAISEERVTAVSPRLASLLYIRVNGPVAENAILSRFFAPSFYEYGPIMVTSEILNRGDYHITPRGYLTLTNIFGNPTAQVALKELNIFPDVSRSYANSLGSKWMLGRYKISLMSSYGEKGRVIESAAYVWVFPWRVALAVVLTLIILILIINNFYKNVVVKESGLEEEIKKEQEEIEKLKQQLRKKG